MVDVKFILRLSFYAFLSIIAGVTAVYGLALTASHGVQLWLAMETSAAISIAVVTGYLGYLTWRYR
jgi:hypothetical protein